MSVKSFLSSRKPIPAATIAVMLSPIIGMLYLNKGKLALIYLSLTAATIALDTIFEYYSTPYREMLSNQITLILTLFGAVHCYKLAKIPFTNATKIRWYAHFAAGISILTLYFIITLITIIYPIRVLLYEPFHIPSESMLPTLHIEDYLFADKSAYGYTRYSLPFNLPIITDRILRTPIQRGDIVIFDLPKNPDINYIKRIIGLPNETIQIKNGIVYIDGKELLQTLISSGSVNQKNIVTLKETLPEGQTHLILSEAESTPTDNTAPVKIPEGHYFVMGDNRDHSQDSRVIGTIEEKFIIGKAKIRYYKGDTQNFSFETIQ